MNTEDMPKHSREAPMIDEPHAFRDAENSSVAFPSFATD